MKTDRQLDRSTFLIGLISGTIFIGFFDPVNWPKQIALVSALPLLVLFSRYKSGRVRKIEKNFGGGLVIVTGALITVTSLYSWIFLKIDISRVLFGLWGRNNGFLTLLSLLVILYVFFTRSNEPGVEIRVLRSIEVVSVVYSTYGILQLVGRDPVEWAQLNQVFAFFGNSNFAAAIFALSTISSLALLLFTENNQLAVTFRLILICIFAFLSYSTSSIQGITAIVLATTLFAFIKYGPRGSRARITTLASLFVVGIFVLVSFVGLGPLGTQLEQYTLKLRFEYWLAGIKMGLSSPFFGVGVDSYGDFYRIYRSYDVIKITSLDLQTNNAHNVFIQLFATLGIVGVAAIIIPFILATVVSFKLLLGFHSSYHKQMIVVVFLSLWTMAFFSIDNIGIAVWNYLFLGLVFGYFVNDSKFGERLFERFSVSSNETKKIRLDYDAARFISWVATAMIFSFTWYASTPDRELQRILSVQPSVSGDSPVQSRIDEVDRALKHPFVTETHFWHYASELNKARANVDQLIVTIDNALEKYPNDFSLLDIAGGVREQANIFAPAIPFRERQIAREGRHPRVWLSYAFDLKNAGRGAEAANAFKKVLEFREFLGDDILSQLPDLAKEFGVTYSG